MALRDPGALLVGRLLMLLVVTVIGIDDIAELADLVLEVDGANFGVIEMCSCRQMRSVRGSPGISTFPGRFGAGWEGTSTVPFNCSRSSGKGCFNLSAKPGIFKQVHWGCPLKGMREKVEQLAMAMAMATAPSCSQKGPARGGSGGESPCE